MIKFHCRCPTPLLQFGDTFVYIIAANVIANVISDFVVDWLKKFFKDND